MTSKRPVARRKAKPAAAHAAPEMDQRRRDMISRLRRIEGQIRGIQGMIQAEADCEAVAQQVAAARRALDRAFYEIIACTMEAEIDASTDLRAARAVGGHISRILSKYG